MTVHDEARKAQEAHFEKNDGLATEEVRRATADLYDGLDRLPPEKRSLLTAEAMSRLHSIHVAELDGGEQMFANGLVAVVGYVNELSREEAGQTSTGDKEVDAVLEGVRTLVMAAITAMIGPEHSADVQAAVARVKERVEAGEDLDTVAQDEAVKAGIKHNHPVEAPAASDDRYASGFYL